MMIVKGSFGRAVKGVKDILIISVKPAYVENVLFILKLFNF